MSALEQLENFRYRKRQVYVEDFRNLNALFAGEWDDIETLFGRMVDNRHWAQGTIKQYLLAVQSFRSWVQPRILSGIPFSDNTIYEWLKSLRSLPLSPRTKNQRMFGVKAFFVWLAQSDYLDNNYDRLFRNAALKLPDIHVRFGFKPEHVQFIWRMLRVDLEVANKSRARDAVQTRYMILRKRCIYALMALVGLRTWEIASLDIGDVDLDGRVLIVKQKWRDVPEPIKYQEKAHSAIKQYFKWRASHAAGNVDAPLFISESPINKYREQEAKLKTTAIAQIMRSDLGGWQYDKGQKYFARGRWGFYHHFKLENVFTPHDFRHYYVTEIVRTSENLLDALQFTRHRSINALRPYYDALQFEHKLHMNRGSFSGL